MFFLVTLGTFSPVVFCQLRSSAPDQIASDWPRAQGKGLRGDVCCAVVTRLRPRRQWTTACDPATTSALGLGALRNWPMRGCARALKAGGKSRGDQHLRDSKQNWGDRWDLCA
jgi:hypothetical protein